MNIEVWAPRARAVEVDLSERRVPLAAVDNGWFAGEIEGLVHGDEYAFVLDGNEPLADPRSGWQPRGVDGPSAIVDHEAFTWTDIGSQPQPMKDWVIYELHIGTFTRSGTFLAARERLDHLVDLGINAVELMPVAEFSGDRGWGYDGVGLFVPHHAYGTPDELKKLVDSCHERQIAVILDVVYNHLGPVGNHLEKFGPYFTDRYKTPWGRTINLDGEDSDVVRAFICDNVRAWLRDYHFDALRLDAVHAIFDQSAVNILEELAGVALEVAESTGRRKALIAESDLNDPRTVRDIDSGGYGIDAQWSDDFHHSLHAWLTGETDGYYQDFGTSDDVAKALNEGYVYTGGYSKFRRRRHGRPTTPVPLDRFVGYVQNHDQVGNRALGERSAGLMSAGKQRIAAALLLMSPLIPMVFAGEEWGTTTPFYYFTDHGDPELGREVTEGRRKEFSAFGWDPNDIPDPQELSTFESSRLDWDELARSEHTEILDWYRTLIELRAQRADLKAGEVCTAEAIGKDCVVLRRGSVVVVCNAGSRPAEIELDDDVHEVLAASGGARVEGRVAKLPAESVVIAIKA